MIKNEKKSLDEMLKCKEMEHKHSKAKEEVIQDQLALKKGTIICCWGSHKLSNMLKQSESPLCKLGLGGENHKGEVNTRF